MTTVAFTEAKAKLSELLDRVSKGEEITITRFDQAVAKLVPAQGPSREEMLRVIQGIKESRKNGPKATLDEIIDWKNAGRR